MLTGATAGTVTRACGVLASIAVSTAACAAWGADKVDTVFEKIPPGEAEQIGETAAITTTLQDKRAQHDPSQEGKLLRGVHPKSHGCVRAEFQVNGDIAEEYRVGLFARPGQAFDAWIRYSNAAALREDDVKADAETGKLKHGSRGMAVKVLDVEGAFLDQDHGRQNQDFLMISTPEFAFADVRSYLRLNKVLLRSEKGDVAAPFFLPLKLAQEGKPVPPAGDLVWGDLWAGFTPTDFASTLGSAKVVAKIEGQTIRNPLQAQYFGAAPFLFGPDRAMKFSAGLCSPSEQAPFNSSTDGSPSPNYLREALTETMQGTENICIDFKIQVRDRDELGEELIENASVAWPNELGRYENVARITIPVPQSPQAAEAIEHCEKLAFTPWHSLAAHQPIGGINRLRQSVYYSSASHRGAAAD